MSKVVLAIHGGAGNIDPANQNKQAVAERLQALEKVLHAGFISFQEQHSAIDLVEQAVIRLEDYPGFNAGHGSVLTRDGKVEMDAAIMDGRTRDAGAVTYVQRIKNPIHAARAVMERTEHVLIAGVAAEEFCKRQKIPLEDNSFFITNVRYKQWQELKDSGDFKTCIDTHALGTVGAVALDLQGNLSAATSTGGRLNKLPGRIGDTPIVGAGTWADNETAAISGTGHGEAYIKAAFAHEIHALMHYKKMTLKNATNRALKKVAELGGRGGVIALDKEGNVALNFNTNAMYRGFVLEDGTIEVDLF